MHYFRLIILAVLLTLTCSLTVETSPLLVSKTDKCPVCGMFVAKYPDFIAQIIFTDGSYAVFDGAKDLFKYYFNLKKYNPKKEPADIAFIYVTDYYNVTPIEGSGAWFVVGSDVFGPMGRELIPLGQENDAMVFMKDHSGVKMLRFNEVTPEIIKELD
jgi:nitrous oxide reductase accessory protein NosL